MVNLSEVRQQVEALSAEDKEGLLAYLSHELPEPPVGADDSEVLRREAEMDSGEVEPITHEEFLKQVGRG